MIRLPNIFVSLLLLVASLNAGAVSPQEFDELHVSGPCELTIVQSADSVGLLSGRITPAVEFRRVGSTLYIAVDPAAVTVGRVPLRLHVASAPSLQLLEISGRAIVTAEEISSPGYLSLVSSAGASLRLKSLSAANVNISLTGAGKIDISGPVTSSTLNLSLVGSGVIKADGVTVSRMTVSQRGSGKIICLGSARDCDVVGRGTGSVDLRNLVAGMMDLRMLGAGHIYYPSGVRVSLSGDTENIIQVKPYQPL